MKKEHDHKRPGTKFPRLPALTDLGNAERLVIAHGDDLRFFHKQWHWWDGSRFAPDQNGEVKRRAKATVRDILIEATIDGDKEWRVLTLKHQQQSESSRALSAMLGLAESEAQIAAIAGEFDRDPMMLNVTNGTLDLRTGHLREHDRRDLITKLAPVAYEPKATAPKWERFLTEIMDGDAEKVSFLRRAVGYSLTGDVSEHVFFLLHGTGANGKSTFLEAVRTLFGDYAQQSAFSTFLATKGDAIRNDIARLRGARFVSAVESDAGRRLNESVVKHMTGADTVTARHLYKEFFEFTPQFKLWLATNNRPKIIGTDEAIWRRIRLIPFTVTIPAHLRDRDLPEKLKRELPGILNWALVGLAEWRERGLAEPQAVNTASEDYRRREDVLGRFLYECTVREKGSKARAARLYETYTEWVKQAGEFQLRQRDFNDALEARGFKKRRGSLGFVWRGIRLLGRSGVV